MMATRGGYLDGNTRAALPEVRTRENFGPSRHALDSSRHAGDVWPFLRFDAHVHRSQLTDPDSPHGEGGAPFEKGPQDVATDVCYKLPPPSQGSVSSTQEQGHVLLKSLAFIGRGRDMQSPVYA